MNDQLWGWLLSTIGLIGFWLAGKKIWWAWYVNIANQAVWLLYAILTQQWGFLVGVVVYTIIFTKNAIAWTKERQSTPLKARKGPSEARTYPDGTSVHNDDFDAYSAFNEEDVFKGDPLAHKHTWRFKTGGFLNTLDNFYMFECESCKDTRHIQKNYFWDGMPNYTTHHSFHVTRETEALTEALEAIRFTQEYAQLPCVDGWSWWDFYKKYRPDDAKRLKKEWEAFEKSSGPNIVIPAEGDLYFEDYPESMTEPRR